MNFEIVLASTNKHKVEEYRSILSKHGITLYSFSDLNLTLPEVEENGKTFEENAIIKAEAAAKLVRFPVIADDSGLTIEALNNKPGIKTARFAKECGSQIAANNKIIELLKDKKNRNASFHCVIALINLTDNPLIFEGEAKGEITKTYNNETSFGYDPIFFSLEANETFHNLDKDKKNVISHRAKACKKLLTMLKVNNLINK